MNDRVRRWLTEPGVAGRLGALVCVVAATAALVARYPATIADLGRTAGVNASRSFTDREIAGGNAVVPDQELLYQARARIPRDASYHVAIGDPHESWSELTETYAAGFFESFLLPRRLALGAPWVICLNCDRGRYGGGVVWENEEGDAILVRGE
ncbi:MAG TPA: hypothetical protein VNB06_03605 [Thermoanaerobaculia bacterium]|nr:hypothetical protein [Thermoanaerobaculia bacterium]